MLTLILRNILNKIIKVSSKIIGQERQSLATFYNIKVLRKGTLICTDPSHSLSSHYTLAYSRYRSLPLRTKRASLGFVPTSIRLFNGLRLQPTLVLTLFIISDWMFDCRV